MKRLLLILILTFSFQTLTKADDIRDFEIEGMSIGDSLLDYFTNKQVKKFAKITYDNANDKKFHKLEITDDSLSSRFKEYDSVAFYIKKNDKNYIIQSIIGIIFFENKIKDCLKKKNKIVSQISLNLNTIFDNGKYTASFDKNTEYHQSETSIGSDVVSITCYDWSVKLQKKNNWVDNLSVELYKNEVVIFIRNNS